MYLNLAEVYRFVLVTLGVAVTLLCLQMITQALVPDFTRRSHAAFDRPFRVIGCGLAGWLGLAVWIFILSKIPILNVIGAIMGILAALFAICASAGLARRIGWGLQSPVDKDQPWRRVWRGAWLMLGLNIVPFVNVIGALIMLVGGLGAGMMAVLGVLRERKQTQAVEEIDF